MDWDNSDAEKDPYYRFKYGIPPAKDKADFSFRLLFCTFFFFSQTNE
jgi:hypothetical protein